MTSSISSSVKGSVVVVAKPEGSHSHSHDHSGHGKLPMWVWIVIIFLCLCVLGLAIGLGVVAGQDDECAPVRGIQRTPYVAVDPFDGLDGNARTELDGIWGKMTKEHKFGQITQLSSGSFSGVLSAWDEAILDQVKRGLVGSLLNCNNAATANMLQREAVNANGVPILIGYDTIHGYKTIFPMNIGMAASFNATMHYNAAKISAEETRMHGIHQTFAPMLDIARDARWGRTSESCGESPYLTGKIGAKLVEGFLDGGIMPCIKHFAAYGAGTAGRDYNPADMSLQTLYNDYLPAYKEALDAGMAKGKAMSVMASFNTINNVPAHANKWLLSELLRDDWNFNGIVVSDYTGIAELLEHSVAASPQEAFAKSIAAGVDLDMAGNYSYLYAQLSVDEGLVDEETLFLAAKRVLRSKWDLGLLPVNNLTLFVPEDETAFTWVNDASRAVARDSVRQSTVLLKNQNAALPIIGTPKIGVIGYMADSGAEHAGSWMGQQDPTMTVTVLKGIVNRVGVENVAYEPGFARHDQPLLMTGSCVVPDPKPSGWLVPPDWDLIGQSVNAATPYPCNDDTLNDAAVALTADPLITHLVIVMGEGHTGGQQMSGEATSRSNLDIPAHQKNLLKKILDANVLASPPKKIILLLTSGRAMTIEAEVANPLVDSIMYIWAPGTEGGNGVADLLFNVDASNGFGRMPVTMPRTVGQCPIFAESMKTGRPAIIGKDWGNATEIGDVKYKSRYIDVRKEALFPFGFGLTYSTFEYTSAVVTPQSLTSNATGNFTVTCNIKNNGVVEATEVIQLYVEQPHSVGVATRPRRLLKGFERVNVAAGAVASTNFVVPVHSLGFYNENMEFIVEPTKFIFYCSPNSEHRPNTDFADPFEIDQSTSTTPYNLLTSNVTVTLTL